MKIQMPVTYKSIAISIFLLAGCQREVGANSSNDVHITVDLKNLESPPSYKTTRGKVISVNQKEKSLIIDSGSFLINPKTKFIYLKDFQEIQTGDRVEVTHLESSSAAEKVILKERDLGLVRVKRVFSKKRQLEVETHGRTMSLSMDDDLVHRLIERLPKGSVADVGIAMPGNQVQRIIVVEIPADGTVLELTSKLLVLKKSDGDELRLAIPPNLADDVSSRITSLRIGRTVQVRYNPQASTLVAVIATHTMQPSDPKNDQSPH